MPACVTHSLFSKAVSEQLPENIKNPINSCAYSWGAQGPDFLFCHKYFSRNKERSLKKYGHSIHGTKPSLIFNIMREFLEQHNDPIYRSYVFGFICHYSLDSTCHPYITFLSNALWKERPYETLGTLHGEIEAALDTIILRRETGKLPSEINLKNMYPKNEAVQRSVAVLYRELIFSIFSDDVSEDDIFRSTKDAHFTFACANDRTGLKKRLFDIIEKNKPHVVSSHLVPITENTDIDYANVQNSVWSPNGTEHTESFFDLFDIAREKAVRLISRFDTADFAEETGDISF